MDLGRFISFDPQNKVLKVPHSLCGFLSVTDCWELLNCRNVPEALQVWVARSSYPATDGTRAQGENGQVSGKQQIVGIVQCTFWVM